MEEIVWEETVMILRHRRRHLRTWMAIAVILPVLFVLSWSVIPENKIKPEQNKDIDVSLSWEGSVLTLEIQVTSPLASPGSIVMIGTSATSDLEDCQLIGQIQGAGTYRFELPEVAGDQGYVLLFDPFTREITQSFEL